MILLVVGIKLVNMKVFNFILMLVNIGKVVNRVKIIVINGMRESNDIYVRCLVSMVKLFLFIWV